MNETIVKHLNFGEDAKNKVFTGIDKLTKAVSSTLGAGGKCVIMEGNDGKPIITKDGVTVADSITLLDPVENMGARLIKEAGLITGKTELEPDGSNLALVLKKILQNDKDKQKIFNLIKDLCLYFRLQVQ